MIDIISTKGRSGFTAFLEVVEYEYGDLFSEITGKQPRTPPRGQIISNKYSQKYLIMWTTCVVVVIGRFSSVLIFFIGLTPSVL